MILRWVCEKCSKKWVYPLEKCLYCKGSLTKQKGADIKVIGITKVTIPSPMHPIVPYNILLLEDEHGNRIPRKTMKEYRIGDVYAEQKAKNENAVAIVKVKYDIYEAIKETLGLLSIELKDNKILVKPSIITAAYPYQAINTNPDMLDALLKVLFDFGIKKENIIVGEQALIGQDSMDSASKSGILEVCKKHGVIFADISKGPFEEVASEGFVFRIYREALHRKVINVPIMKTNFQIGISGAMENLSRLADGETQRKMYYDGIDAALPKLGKAISSFTIADATNGMQGQGPLALGEPAFLNLVFAGKDAAFIDAAFCEVAMLAKPDYIKETDVKKIEIVGNEIDAIKYPIKNSIHDETPHPDVKVIDGKACPACLGMMYRLSSNLIGLRGEQLNVVIGSMLTEEMLRGKERLVALGDCAIKKVAELGIKPMAQINENIDAIEQVVLFRKLLTEKGYVRITPIDKVKSKMKKLLSKIVR
ncbi:DUF362 domain-containing protein [Candidatus Woesearchaeota archaeon]|nr:DUF362 domain-containing protein [Candidatus Woesearchaeota archaeon]